MKYRLKHQHNEIDNYAYAVLRANGITDINGYLNPTEAVLHDYHLLDNIREGAELYIKHLQKGSKIYIPPDCDQDGITSAAILWNYTKKLFPDANLVFSMHEGKQHGLTQKMIDAHNDCDLFVILDAGTNQWPEHRQVTDMGIDVIVVDHHECDTVDYDSKAIIINNQMSENYPNKSLCGAAMTLKFCQMLDELLDSKQSEYYYDLAAVGLVGDMMELRDIETRYMVMRGLNDIRNIGLRAIIEKQSFSIGDISHITPTHISFYVAPLVNAVLRVGKEAEKEVLFKAFIQGNEEVQSTKRGAKPGDMEIYAVQNARNCTNARARQNRMKDKAIEYIDTYIQKNELMDNTIIFVEVEDKIVDSTLTGLVATQLTNMYKKPVIVTRMGDEGLLKGSIRNDGSTELNDFKAFLQESGFFDFVEGHANAAGLAIDANSVESFIEYANQALAHIDFNEGVYNVDYVFHANDANLFQAILDIGKMSTIWGRGVEEPKLAIENITLTRKDIQVIGADKTTFKFTHNGVTYIKFKNPTIIEATANLETFTMTIIGRANLNEWGGQISPQIMIEDYDIKDTSLEF